MPTPVTPTPTRRPLSFLWVYDPKTQHVHLQKQRGDHPADIPTHRTVSKGLHISERIDGYAIAKPHGYSIFALDGETNPFIKKRVEHSIEQLLSAPAAHAASIKLADSPITQADATNDPLGKNPALIPQRQGDPDYLDDMPCLRCGQVHRVDEPCADSAVSQWRQQEREWYNRDNNAIHSEADDLDDHQSDLGRTAFLREAMPYNPGFISQLAPSWQTGAGNRTLLMANHPEYGNVGWLNHWQGPNGEIQVGKMMVAPEHQRQGVASWMMQSLEQQYPNTPIDHGLRTPQGQGWAQNYYGDGSDNQTTLNGQPQPQTQPQPQAQPQQVAASWDPAEDDALDEWEGEGGSVEVWSKTASAEPEQLLAMQAAITKLADAVSQIQKPSGVQPEAKTPRKLKIHRDEAGRMESIEEV